MKNFTIVSGNVERVFAAIIVAQILEKNDFTKPGTQTVQLRQDVTTNYYKGKPNNSFTDSLDDFQPEISATFTSTRTALLTVADKYKSVAEVQAMINNLPGKPTLVRYISNDVRDVMTPEQLAALDQGLGGRTLDHYVSQRLVRNKDGNQLTDDTGKPLQATFQQFFFRKDYVEDQDFRTKAAIAETEDFIEDVVVKEVSPAKQPTQKKLTSLGALGANGKGLF